MSLTAYIRYDNQGRIVPGGPIVTSVKPKVGDWVAISDVLVTTTPPNYKLRAFVRYINKIRGQRNDNKYVAGSLILQQDAPKDGNWKEVYFIKPCESCNTTTTTSSTSTSTTSTSTSTTTTTSTSSTTTTTTTTNPFQTITLYSNGTLCGVGTDWSQKTPAEVKCDWIEVFAGGSPGYGGSQFLYYISAGFNVGTQLYSESPGNPPVTFSGTYIYDLGGPYLNAKVFTVTTGIISAIYNLGDLPACGPYVCPTNITTEGSDPIITEGGDNLIIE
jgi:hypothetical protein